ncbi:MAG: AbrB/MazE/SpoVT family DNA-binding domain-containing protein [Methanomicrobia archaeon]|nr:AbrB/MazE/SpoVT family DNA-binding domain-containing protein [Methanomicrobia archaeon]
MEIKKGKYIFGTVKVGERGQIVIPKEARDKFSIEPGDSLLVLGDENKGIAIVKEDLMKNFALKILEGMSYVKERVKGEKNE